MTSISIALSPFPQSLQIQTRRATILYNLLSDYRRRRWRPSFPVRASTDSVGNGGGIQIEKSRTGGLQGMISSLPTAMRNNVDLKTTVGLCIASVVFLAIVARQMVLRKKSQKYQGSVADLVRRGQLRSDRRSISKPLKYEDPFNNPLVKAGKSNSTIEMCGKVYRLAPVTLTKEEQSVHQKRRSRAYQWKRPTTFLKEGDSVPPDVDPDTVKWIPANHPFATTVSDIDENLAQNNVYQKHGVPFRIKAEHEEMQKRLEALQNSLRSSSRVHCCWCLLCEPGAGHLSSSSLQLLSSLSKPSILPAYCPKLLLSVTAALHSGYRPALSARFRNSNLDADDLAETFAAAMNTSSPSPMFCPASVPTAKSAADEHLFFHREHSRDYIVERVVVDKDHRSAAVGGRDLTRALELEGHSGASDVR